MFSIGVDLPVLKRSIFESWNSHYPGIHFCAKAAPSPEFCTPHLKYPKIGSARPAFRKMEAQQQLTEGLRAAPNVIPAFSDRYCSS